MENAEPLHVVTHFMPTEIMEVVVSGPVQEALLNASESQGVTRTLAPHPVGVRGVSFGANWRHRIFATGGPMDENRRLTP